MNYQFRNSREQGSDFSLQSQVPPEIQGFENGMDQPLPWDLPEDVASQVYVAGALPQEGPPTQTNYMGHLGHQEARSSHGNIPSWAAPPRGGHFGHQEAGAKPTSRHPGPPGPAHHSGLPGPAGGGGGGGPGGVPFPLPPPHPSSGSLAAEGGGARGFPPPPPGGGAAGPGGGGGGGGGGWRRGLPDSLKRQRRLEKNRESARECRRRKKERLARLGARVAEAEAANRALRLRLRVGAEAAKRERREKAARLAALRERLGGGAPDAELAALIRDYKERFSDYGRDRSCALAYHLRALQALVLPTNTTRLAIWGMGRAGRAAAAFRRGEQSAAAVAAGSAEGAAAAAAAGPAPCPGGGGGGGDKEEGEAAAPVPPGGGAGEEEEGAGAGEEGVGGGEAAAAGRFWALIGAELGLTGAQRAAIMGQRAAVADLERDLGDLKEAIAELRRLVVDKNRALDREMEELQRILTPTQTAKFMLWVKQNPGCMYMLNQLWNQIFNKSPTGHLPEKEGAIQQKGLTSIPADEKDSKRLKDVDEKPDTKKVKEEETALS